MATHNIMLIGKTGHGKSSTANTLVGSKVFKSSGSSSSTTKEIQYATTTIDGHHIRVVDSPGMKDTADHTSDSAKAIDYMRRALKTCDNRIHLFLFVFKYGVKFTSEEIEAIRTFYLNGNNKTKFLPKCAVLFTNGAEFDLDNADRVDFQVWCKQQRELMAVLLRDVQYRAILFENKRVTIERKEKQRRDVIQMAQQVTATAGPYTNREFEAAVDAYEKVDKCCCVM